MEEVVARSRFGPSAADVVRVGKHEEARIVGLRSVRLGMEMLESEEVSGGMLGRVSR